MMLPQPLDLPDRALVGVLDWLALNQRSLLIGVLSLLAILLLYLAIRLFKHASQPGMRNLRRRSESGAQDFTEGLAPGMGSWRLIDVSGQTIPLRPLPFTIGRAAGNALVLDDPSVAPQHARILYDPAWGSLTIEDLDSPAGIQVEGLPTRQNLLQAGVHLKIGRYVFTLLQQAA